jgi:N-acylneuraminate cytidylyltransferase
MSGALAVVAGPRGAGLPLVAGRPRLAWAVEAARDASGVGRVLVAAADPEAARLAARLGAESLEVAPDAVADADATLRLALARAGGDRPELLAWLPSASPLVTAADIDGTIAALRAAGGSAAEAVAVLPATGRPLRADGGASADAPAWLDPGLIRVVRASALGATRAGGPPALHPLPIDRGAGLGPGGAADLDLDLAEVVLRRRQAGDRLATLPDRLDALVFDFDGVFTDNKVTVLEEGREAVVCDRSDGLGLERLRKAGWPILVLSKETHPIVSARCAKLKLECRQGIEDKRPELERWLRLRGLGLERTLYLGNDINDLPCLTAVGFPVAVADAYPEALRAARLVLSRPGGKGAIRELADLIAARFAGPAAATATPPRTPDAPDPS